MEADLTRPVATLVALRKIGEFIDIDNNKILIVGRKRENVRTDSINFIAFKEDDIIGLHSSERISILAEARFNNNRFQLLSNSASGVKKESLKEFSEIVTQNF